MKQLAVRFSTLLFACAIASSAFAQTFARSPNPKSSPPSSDAAQIEALIKKIDEQNAKIDMLSQQILKLEQQLANSRPGVMVGEGAPSPPTSTAATSPSSPSPSPANGNSHVVARGETLTSIAKAHNVSVAELQKYNHIENPLKLQAGQTIMIPALSSPSPSTSGE